MGEFGDLRVTFYVRVGGEIRCLLTRAEASSVSKFNEVS
ncbi:Hypothetical protein A7982_07699 [Minicystis rosea]|nr:Hypothetical protein A7982_07699 [Minicystis rosea]